MPSGADIINGSRSIIGNCLIAIFFFCSQHINSQHLKVDINKLESLSFIERNAYVNDLDLESLDSTAFLSVYNPLLEFSKDKDDSSLEWNLRFQYFQQRIKLQTSAEKSIEHLIGLEELAAKNGYKIRQAVAQHYLSFEKYYSDQLPLEVLYTHILSEIDLIQKNGFEEFKTYNIDRILYHDAKLLYEIGDYDKALQFFHMAEEFIYPTDRKRHTYVLVLNHIQAIYQKRDEISKAIEYANKILRFVEQPPTNDPGQLEFYQQWQGLVFLDLASMLVKQRKFSESESYAQKGYELSKAKNFTNRIALRLEYDALQVLVSTKLEMDHIDEVEPLIKRLDQIYTAIGGDYENYFNNIEYFECLASFHEKKDEFSKSVHFSKMANSLKDSLTRRNNVRNLEQLKQRLEAEKYAKKINLLEQEREFQRRLRNIAFIILSLVLIFAFLYFQRLHRQRQNRIADLNLAKNELEELTQLFREKSTMAENLRSEMEVLANSGQRSLYLETLTNSTILTDEDWLRFRQLFEKAYPGFIEEKKFQIPKITPAELRYLVLKKLNLSTKEMANMLGVSPNAVRKTRARLQNKMEF